MNQLLAVKCRTMQFFLTLHCVYVSKRGPNRTFLDGGVYQEFFRISAEQLSRTQYILHASIHILHFPTRKNTYKLFSKNWFQSDQQQWRNGADFGATCPFAPQRNRNSKIEQVRGYHNWKTGFSKWQLKHDSSNLSAPVVPGLMMCFQAFHQVQFSAEQKVQLLHEREHWWRFWNQMLLYMAWPHCAWRYIIVRNIIVCVFIML